ncbi:MAG: hypothetical protein GY926_23025 [bacterium]|nr:hypothetical protein [bacterium]
MLNAIEAEILRTVQTAIKRGEEPTAVVFRADESEGRKWTVKRLTERGYLKGGSQVDGNGDIAQIRIQPELTNLARQALSRR